MKKLRFSAARAAPLVLILIGVGASLSFGVHARSMRRTATTLFDRDYSLVRSHLQIDSEGNPVFDFADIARPDVVIGCPILHASSDLRSAVADLVKKIDDSVKANQDNSAACRSLGDRLNGSRDELMNTINTTYVANAENLDEKQLRINDATRQASAVSSFVATTSDLIDGRCLTKNGSAANVQRLVGQMITLGGLVLGGWPGLVTAAGGNVLGRLPLFKSDVDQAKSQLDHYNNHKNRASFLCLYRELQKTSCLVFSAPQNHVFYGNDLNYEVEPTKTTHENADRLRKENPALYREIAFLHRVAARRDSLTKLDDLATFCKKTDDTLFAGAADLPHPAAILDTYAHYRKACADLNAYRYPQPNEEGAFVASALRDLRIFSAYLGELKVGGGVKSATDAVSTYMSLLAFEDLAAKLRPLRDPTVGNFDRLEFGKLVNDLGKRGDYAVRSFQMIEKEAKKNFASSDLREDEGVASDEIRGSGLRAWLDLCQSGDPTLACLYPADPNASAYFETWKKSCAGPDSNLCRTAKAYDADALLGRSADYRAYLKSLCEGTPADQASAKH